MSAQSVPEGSDNPRGRARRPHPRFLQRHPREPEAADTPELLAEADRVAAATAWSDEPEALGPGVADQYGEHAAWLREQERAARLAARAASREHLTAEQRLAHCRHLARRHHADISGDAHRIEQGIAEARDVVVPYAPREPRPAIVRLLVKLEGRLDALL